MNQRRPYPTAAGHSVHRVRTQATTPESDEPQRADGVPVIERYQDMAAMMHKRAVAPRGDRYLIGCSCGWVTLSPIGCGSGRASLIAQQHVLDKADEMMAALEPKPLEEAM